MTESTQISDILFLTFAIITAFLTMVAVSRWFDKRREEKLKSVKEYNERKEKEEFERVNKESKDLLRNSERSVKTSVRPLDYTVARNPIRHETKKSIIRKRRKHKNSDNGLTAAEMHDFEFDEIDSTPFNEPAPIPERTSDYCSGGGGSASSSTDSGYGGGSSSSYDSGGSSSYSSSSDSGGGGGCD